MAQTTPDASFGPVLVIAGLPELLMLFPSLLIVVFVVIEPQAVVVVAPLSLLSVVSADLER